MAEFDPFADLITPKAGPDFDPFADLLVTEKPKGLGQTVGEGFMRTVEGQGVGTSVLLGRDPGVIARDLADVGRYSKRSAAETEYQERLGGATKRFDERPGLVEGLDVISSMFSQPKQLAGSVAEAGATVVPALAGGAAGAVVGGPLGAVVGLVAGSEPVNVQAEIHQRLTQALTDRHIDPTNVDAVTAALKANPDILSDVTKKGLIAGTGTTLGEGAVTLATAGAGRLLGPATSLLGRSAQIGGAAVGAGFGEGVGEVTGKLAVGEPINWGEVLQSTVLGTIAEGPMGVGELVLGERSRPAPPVGKGGNLGEVFADLERAGTVDEAINVAARAMDPGLDPGTVLPKDMVPIDDEDAVPYMGAAELDALLPEGQDERSTNPVPAAVDPAVGVPAAELPGSGPGPEPGGVEGTAPRGDQPAVRNDALGATDEAAPESVVPSEPTVPQDGERPAVPVGEVGEPVAAGAPAQAVSEKSDAVPAAPEGQPAADRAEAAANDVAFSRVELGFKDVVKRTPELQEAAKELADGKIDGAEYDRRVNKYKPVEPYSAAPDPTPDAEIRKALTSDKVEKVGAASKSLKPGDPVGLRLDIPAYSKHGAWVVSVHEQGPGFAAGKAIGYEPVAAVKNPRFGVVEKAALNIAQGKPKATIAVIKGDWNPITPRTAKNTVAMALKSGKWAQVGMDPERHAYFYDRKTMKPVVSADEVVQVGPLVMAKNPVYGSKTDFAFSRDPMTTPRDASGKYTQASMEQRVARIAHHEAAIREGWKNAPPIKIIETIDQAPPEVVAAAKSGGGNPDGFIRNGTVYLVADQIKNEAQVRRVMLHESLGHFGLRGTFGSRLDSVLDQVAAARPKTIADRLAKEPGLNRRQAAEEVLAYWAQENPKHSIVKRAIGAVRKALRAMGFKLQLSDTDILNEILVPARKFVEKGSGSVKGGLAFSRQSTRLPGGRDATEDPMASVLHVGLASSMADADSFRKNVAHIEQYPNFRPGPPGETDAHKAERFIQHVVDNLLWLHDQVPDDTRKRSKLWYEGARHIAEQWAKRFDLTDVQISGVLAVLSPQKDWFMNVSLAERVLDTMTTKQDYRWDDEMTATAAKIFGKDKFSNTLGEITGKTLGELTDNGQRAMWVRAYDEAHNNRNHRIVTPEGYFSDWKTNADGETRSMTGWGSLAEIGKAISVIQDGSRENVSAALGEKHKVRNFYNNIFDPKADEFVTIDTHAVAAGLLRPLSGESPEVTQNFGGSKSKATGSSGTYGIYAEAYRRAARERGILAREMQSITWEAVRGLFEAGFKAQQRNLDSVDAAWNNYKNGASYEATRAQVLELAGQTDGITQPDWWRPGGRGPTDTEKGRSSSYQGELSQVRVPRRPARVGRGAGAEPARADSEVAFSRVPDEDIVNPVDPKASNEEKLAHLLRLTEENEPIVKDLMARVNEQFGLKSGSSRKKPENIVAKSERPSILAKKPWFRLEHVRDSFRFKTILQKYSDLPAIIGMAKDAGIQFVKVDVDKVLKPLDWGWRIASFDIRMPNGQLVEWYLPIQEQELAKKAKNHHLFEKWRVKDVTKLSKEEKREYQVDLAESRRLYQEAWDQGLARSGEAEAAIALSLQDTASLGEAGLNSSLSSSAEKSLPSTHLPLTKDPQSSLSESRTITADPSTATDTTGSISTPSNKSILPRIAFSRQTEAPGFKAWFKDSKVVDANGKPLVVYHGTNAQFEAFRAESKSVNSTTFGDVDTERTGIFLTDNPDFAKQYGDSVGQYFVSMQNPADLTKDLRLDFIESIDAFEERDLWLAAKERKGWGLLEGDVGRRFVAYLKDKGHDGVRLEEDLETDDGSVESNTVVAFEPTQIKSATGNNGNFDPADPRIAFSRQDFTVDEPGKMDDAVRALQDKFVDLRRTVSAIKATSRAISDKWNPYLQEELYHGRTAHQTKQFLDKELDPIVKEMVMSKVSMKDIETYLHNRHAEERNVQMAKINPKDPKMQDGGSGIKTADARAYLANLSSSERQKYESIAKKVDAINRKTQRILVASGLEKQSTIDAWNAAYKNYVPLQRDEVPDHRQGQGQGYNIKGSFAKKAKGSDKAVIDIMANVAMTRERAIVRAEKNRVSQSLWGLAAQVVNEDFWKAVDPTKITKWTGNDLAALGIPAHLATVFESPQVREVDPKTGLVRWVVDTRLRDAPNVVTMRVNGEDRFVILNANNERAVRLAAAMKNLDADQMGRVISSFGQVSRYFASINTQFNPIFGVVNLTRDIQGSLVNLSSTPLAGKQWQVMKNMRHIFQVYGHVRNQRKGNGKRNAISDAYDEFTKEGGQTGFKDMFEDSTARAKSIQKEIDNAGKGAIRRLANMPSNDNPIFNWLSDYNEALENVTRLAVYMAGKDNNLSNQQSASLAKNISVNFNRKGNVANTAGAFYAFFNASMQGSARLKETVIDGPAGKRIIAGGIGLGVMQAVVLSMAGFDDGEPPDFVRERNIIIPTGDGKYVSIPMPLGLHVIPNFSRIATEFFLSGGKDPAKHLTNFLTVLAEAFNPIGNAGLSMQTVAPTAADPFVALFENKDYTGKNIAREDFNSLHPTPGFTRAKDTASTPSKWLSQAINTLTGGSDYKPGSLSPTPDQIDYLAGQFFGGVGRELLKTDQSVRSSVSGEELPWHKVPLVGRFYGDTTGQSSQATKFYDNLKELGLHKAEIDGRRKDGKSPMEYMKENPEWKLIPFATEAEREVSKLRKMKHDLVEKEADKEKIKKVEDQITQRMKNLNERVEKLHQ